MEHLHWIGSETNLRASRNNYLIFQDDNGNWFMKDPVYKTFREFNTVDDAKDEAQDIYNTLNENSNRLTSGHWEMKKILNNMSKILEN